MGKCLCPDDVAIVARASLHPYEEPPISGTRGSGTVFFSGCTMRCTFCQNVAISRAPVGKRLSAGELAVLFRRLEEAGAHNINLVNPTHFVPVIAEAFSIYRPAIPVVYNSSGYELPETLAIASTFVDIWLPDYKYASPSLAYLLSARADYPDVAESALLFMRASKQDIVVDGLMKQGLIVRHLVLPEHLDDTKEALKRLAAAVGTSTTISLMAQYTPMTGALHAPTRALTPLEYKIVLRAAEALGFQSIFTQEISSSSTVYIPDWTDTGLL